MWRVKVSIFALFCLSACTPLPVEGSRVQTGPYSEFSGATKIAIGMTRDEVAEVVGRRTYSITPEGFMAVCDSHQYEEDGKTMYTHILYNKGKVIGVIDRNSIPCYL